MTDVPSALRGRWLAAALVASLAACGSPAASTRPGFDEADLRLLPATLRMVGAETTWVTGGLGYELVARSRLDLAILQPGLDEQARLFRRVFSADPARILVVARHPGRRAGDPPQPAPALPADAIGPVIEVIVPPAEQAVGAGFAAANGVERPRGVEIASNHRLASPFTTPAVNVVRQWLAALAATLPTKRTGPGSPVPDWADDAVPALVLDPQTEDALAVQLSWNVDSLLPLGRLLTMRRPPRDAEIVGAHDRRADRGFLRGAPTTDDFTLAQLTALREAPPLHGGALFSAQALLFARYVLSREGHGMVGALIVAQIMGEPLALPLAGAKSIPHNESDLERDWRRWLLNRGEQIAGRGRR